MAAKVDLVPIARTPSAVELHADRVVFNVVGPAGEVVDGLELHLEALLKEADPTPLLLFGLMMQIGGLRALVERQAQIATAIDPLDPEFIRGKMSQLAPVVMSIMKDAGFVLPGAPNVPTTRKPEGS